jgi:hypothetical protein
LLLNYLHTMGLHLLASQALSEKSASTQAVCKCQIETYILPQWRRVQSFSALYCSRKLLFHSAILNIL